MWKSHPKTKQMIDNSWHSRRKAGNKQERVGRSDSLGKKMLFAALVKIMTHQMERFKEIRTQLSWLSSFSILYLLCFPLAALLHCLFASHKEYHKALKKHTERYSSLRVMCMLEHARALTHTDTHTRTHFHIHRYRYVANTCKSRE